MMDKRACLDDDIGRVAAALTAVPPDEDFTARMNQRIDAGGTARWMWVAPAMAAAVLVLMVAANVDRTEQTAPLRSRAIAATTFEEARAPIIVERIATITVPAPVSPRPSSRAGRESLVPPIAALAEPETLSVDALTFPSLAVAPVEFDMLDLRGLEVRDIDASTPKEQ